MRALASLPVLVVDCQATAAAPKGRLLELAWARVGAEPEAVRSRLVRLPAGESVPAAVARITGLTSRDAARGVSPGEAFAALLADAEALGRPAPAVAHFARFERPFFEALGASAAVELVCTHELALRLFPELPRRSLRALSGYFGRAVSALRRGAEHVEATAFVWRALLPLLAERGVTTWEGLRDWLAQPAERKRRARYGWPMPREVRLGLPDAPGLYRMLRHGGDVLYVGKATSLKKRVNSYFRKNRGVHERTLEMLSQARGLSWLVAESPLEAALLEPDEIKRHRPPYNVAQLEAGRSVWFTSADFGARSDRASAACPIGPFPSPELIDQLAALARGDRSALGPYGPAPEVFSAGLARFRAAHRELADTSRAPTSRLLALGGRLWREGRRAGDEGDMEEAPTEEASPRRDWTPELAQLSMEWLAIRGALALRRARWLTRLSEATLTFRERGAEPRLLVLEAGALAGRAAAGGLEPPVPAGHRREPSARHEGFDVARLDRLRVLTTELKRLVEEGAPVALRLGAGRPWDNARLARALGWL